MSIFNKISLHTPLTAESLAVNTNVIRKHQATCIPGYYIMSAYYLMFQKIIQ